MAENEKTPDRSSFEDKLKAALDAKVNARRGPQNAREKQPNYKIRLR